MLQIKPHPYPTALFRKFGSISLILIYGSNSHILRKSSLNWFDNKTERGAMKQSSPAANTLSWPCQCYERSESLLQGIFKNRLLWFMFFMQVLPYCVYVLISLRDREQYIGFTTNIEKRLIDHNNGNTKSTAPRRPLELVYCEFYTSKNDAMQRENYFKTSNGKRTLKLMLQDTRLIKEMN